jgi:dipeptidyl aminopeptidase/acylaminoacyl peptidase
MFVRGSTAVPALAVVGLLVGGCSLSSDEPTPSSGDAVLYGIGVSTDPYGNSSPNGFGVVARVTSGRPTKVEIRRDGWCSERAVWISPGKLVVPERGAQAPFCSRQVIFNYRAGRLERAGRVPFTVAPNTWDFALSPDRRLVAIERAVRCCGDGQKPGGVIFVARGDGSRQRQVTRGHLAGWTPDGRVLFSTGQVFEFRAGDFLALNLTTGKSKLVLSHRTVAERARVREAEIGSPVWSSDRRYFAARALLTPAGARKPLRAVVLAEANGKIIRLLRSPYEISMFAWSPRGQRLAYTTSGFPDPHELFVLDHATAKPRRLYATSADHFDWITWSPDGRWLLIDEEHQNRWLLVRADRSGTRRPLPRLGGRPLWCCPQNAFSAG